ncbi:hypothetical protein BDF14DRAFT_1764920 [Spinellus fusiger]|nr:hypothetical protein BDF14DRAFT_1764920 [Spinellus fusiger]
METFDIIDSPMKQQETPQQETPQKVDTALESADSKTEEQSADDAATQEAKATLEALEELPVVMEKLEQDTENYELHVRLITLLTTLDFPDQLETARQAMHDIYPLSEAMWLAWINDAKKQADTEQGEAYLLSLYDEAEKDYLFISVWKSYTEFILEKFNVAWDKEGEEEESKHVLVETTREALLKAVRATHHHVSQSHEIWNVYGEFEVRILKYFESPETLSHVKQVYLNRLEALHMECEQTFNAYSNLIGAYDNDHYEANMVEANKIYAKTKEAANERGVFEHQLIQSGYALDTFYEYIENEKIAKKKFSLNAVRNLYERAVAIYCTDVGLWNDYVLFLVERARIQVFLEAITLRAVRNCPWSGVLWSHLARVMESGHRSPEQMADIFDRALESKPLLSSLEDLVTLLKAKCDYERRRIDWEDVGEEDVMDLRVAFEEAMVYISEAFGNHGDPYYRIEKYYAHIEGNKLGNLKKARELWDVIIKRHGKQAEAWIQYIEFERECGDEQRCLSLFKQAMEKKLDYPERIMNAWMLFEHENGSLDSMQTALVRINKATKLLSTHWLAGLAEQEALDEKMKEKQMALKVKKSAHRRKQKATKKGTLSATDAATDAATDIDNATETAEEVEEMGAVDAIEMSETSEAVEAPREVRTQGAEASLKRNASQDNEAKDQVFKKPRLVPKAQSSAPNVGMVPHRMRSARGRGRGGTRLVMSRDPKKPVEAPTDKDTQAPTVGPSVIPPSAPKSNNDFRAMLLGKK